MEVIVLLALPELLITITRKYNPYHEIHYDSLRFQVPKVLANYFRNEDFVQYPGLLHGVCKPKVMTTAIGYFIKEDEYCARMQPEHFFQRNHRHEDVTMFVPSVWHSISMLFLIVLFCYFLMILVQSCAQKNID
jgi:hypothetical protein